MRHCSAVLVLALVIGSGRAGADEPADRAVAAIEKLGGRVSRDTGQPDKPVVVVDLSGTALTPAEFRDVAAALGQLKSVVYLN